MSCTRWSSWAPPCRFSRGVSQMPKRPPSAPTTGVTLLTGPPAHAAYGIQMFGIKREQGRLEELAPVARLLAASNEGGALWRPALGALLAELGLEDRWSASLSRFGKGARRFSARALAGVAYVPRGRVQRDRRPRDRGARLPRACSLRRGQRRHRLQRRVLRRRGPLSRDARCDARRPRAGRATLRRGP